MTVLGDFDGVAMLQPLGQETGPGQMNIHLNLNAWKVECVTRKVDIPVFVDKIYNHIPRLIIYITSYYPLNLMLSSSHELVNVAKCLYPLL